MTHETTDIDGPVHYTDIAGRRGGPTFVLVHGLGGSHTNWIGIERGLAKIGRVIALDLIGFGRTPLSGRRATISGNRIFLDRFIEAIVGTPVVLIGNSMGGLLSALQASKRPSTVAGLVLIAPAVPRPATHLRDLSVAGFAAASIVPRFGHSYLHSRYRAAGPERVVEETFRLCMAEPELVRPDILEAQIQMARERIDMPWATTAFLEATRSMVRVLARRRRVLATFEEISAPTLLMLGARDRLVPLAAGSAVAAMRPEWDLLVYDTLGHTPMMEDPDAVVADIQRWVDGPAARLITGRPAKQIDATG